MSSQHKLLIPEQGTTLSIMPVEPGSIARVTFADGDTWDYQLVAWAVVVSYVGKLNPMGQPYRPEAGWASVSAVEYGTRVEPVFLPPPGYVQGHLVTLDDIRDDSTVKITSVEYKMGSSS